MQSFIGWIGGKSQLKKEILIRFPEAQPSRYIEVFGGAGWVLFGKKQHSGQMEVFNDIDGQLINLFRCVKFHATELQHELGWLISSRETFFDYLEQVKAHGLTDIQRAARFFYIVKLSFGSDRRTFKTASATIEHTTARLEDIKKRLQGVVIENVDFEQLIHTYDRPSALFYLDPPYHQTERYYEYVFSAEDHHRLHRVLSALKGQFILSYNNDPFIRELYAGFRIEEVSRYQTLSSNGGNKQAFSELIIRNF